MGVGKEIGYSRELPTSAGRIGRCNGITEERYSLLGWRTTSIKNWARKKEKLQRKQVSETQWNEEM